MFRIKCLSFLSAKISKLVNNARRNGINERNRSRLRNKDFTLFANTCNGGVISHDLGLRFNSPFINLWIYPTDYLKILRDYEHYLNYELCFYPIGYGGVNYPVAKLGDVDIYIMHYKTQEEAETKWRERCGRINRNNIFVLFTEKDGCTEKDMQDFDSLDYKNKLLLTHLPHPEISCSFYIKGFEEQKECGILSNWIPKRMSGKRYLDQFDWVGWFNSGTIDGVERLR